MDKLMQDHNRKEIKKEDWINYMKIKDLFLCMKLIDFKDLRSMILKEIKRVPHNNKLRKKQDLLLLRMLYLFLQ
jgi:hypothetical protein